MTKAAKTAVMACMRNGGLFIVEWLAYNHVISFDQVVIYSSIAPPRF
ncbi:hypothetical protein [Planktotalea sp.]|nr:hypothetical protein [Planktotalea sp.]